MIVITVIMKRVYYLLIISAEVEVRIVISGLPMFLLSFMYRYVDDDGWTGSNGKWYAVVFANIFCM